MKAAAAGGAAESPSPSAPLLADNSSGRKRQHRAPSSAGAQEGPTKRPPRRPGGSRSPLSTGRRRCTAGTQSPRPADGREREPESRGAAAVHGEGAEADVVRTNRADAVRADPPDSSLPARRSALRLPFLGAGDPAQRPPSLKETDEEASAAERSVGCGAGLGLGLWKGGCLQAELIHYHLQKRLKRSGGRMQTKAENMETEEAARGEAEPCAEATEAVSVTQQDQAIEDEMERLLEENDDLKVCWLFKCI